VTVRTMEDLTLFTNKDFDLDITGYLEAESNCMTCMQRHEKIDVERTCLCDLEADKDNLVGPEHIICL
jgi:hypothetical protein